MAAMHYTKYLRTAILFGAALVFCIPFIVADGTILPPGTSFPNIFNLLFLTNTFFPFIVGKNIVFRVVVELMLGAYILLAMREPKYRPKASYLMWAFVAFAVWIGITTVTSVDPVKSFWSNFERMQGYITTLHLLAYFVIVTAVVSVERWWDRIFKISIALGTLQAVYALFQLMQFAGLHPSSQSGPRLDGTFGNAIYLGVYMLFNIFLTLFMLVRERHSSVAQATYGVALVLQLATLYYTETRGAVLGLLIGLVVAALYIAWRAVEPEWRTIRKVSFAGLGVIVLLVAVFFAARETSFIQNSHTLQRLASLSLDSGTVQSRVQIWQMAWQGFQEKPVFGWGQENFNFVFNKYYEPSMYSQEQWFDRVHNQFLDWLIAGGLPAFLLYISLFVLAVWILVRSDLSAPEQAILLGLLAGYGFSNMTVFDDISSALYFTAILAFIHTLSRKQPPAWMFLSRPVGDRAIAIAAPIVIAVVLVGVWGLNAPGVARAQNVLRGLQTQVAVLNNQGQLVAAPKDKKENLQDFRRALAPSGWWGDNLGRQEATEQLLQVAYNLAGSQSVDPSLKQDFFTLAQTAGLNMLAARPHDARLELFVGTFYENFGQRTQALQMLEMALKDSPKKQVIMFEMGVLYLNANETNNALPILKQAFEQAPGYTEARIYYAAALYYAGRNAEADKLIMDAYGTLAPDDNRLLQVYGNTKQYGRVIGIWKARIEKDPKNPELYVAIASAYFAAGDKQNTIASLQKAASLNPAIASQVQSLITQINNGTLKP